MENHYPIDDKTRFNVVDLFFENAKKNPEQIAIIDAKRAVSFRILAEEVVQTSHYFLQKGIKKGDKVLIFIGMGVDLYRTVLSLFNIGAVAVFLDPWVNKKRMEECCKTVECQAFIGVLKARILSIFSKQLQKIPIQLGISFPQNHSIENANFQAITYPQDMALITFTTGSTDTPKGSIRTHAILYAQFRALIDKINPEKNEVNMTSLPIMLFINLAAGITSIIPKAKLKRLHLLKPTKILKQIDIYRVSSLIASPFFVKKIAEYALDNQIDTSQIKKIFTGGAPIFAQEAQLYLKAFPKAKIEIVYGSTEAEPISSILAKDIITHQLDKSLITKGLSVGKIDKNTTAKIISFDAKYLSINDLEDFKKHILLPYQVGEIIVSGHHVSKNYFNNPLAEKQNKIWIDGTCWHLTGDSGYLDENNCLFLTGRCNTVITHQTTLIYPFIYEAILLQIPAISLATILKIDEKIIIFVELKNKKQKNEVITQIKLLSIPHDIIECIKKIPRDLRHYAKIDYEKLKNYLP
ncbi:MAG: AMP-dependent synthetase [Bacteroidetes bacterium]|nr:MAG: AMP-dependent synthetase [Bacteroidota bacterium]TAG95569.1 MAG: AMP-dependent synthetase [Bacteroidota bacterium]